MVSDNFAMTARGAMFAKQTATIGTNKLIYRRFGTALVTVLQTNLGLCTLSIKLTLDKTENNQKNYQENQ